MTNAHEGALPPAPRGLLGECPSVREEISRMPSNPTQGGSSVASTHAARYASYRATRVAVEPREPRCRICRDPEVRRLVDDLLDWHGAPLILDGRKHRVTYADILRDLEPINACRDKRDRITYDSLWIHAKRHYDLAGIEKYWAARIYKELRNALGADAGRSLLRSYRQVAPSTNFRRPVPPQLETSIGHGAWPNPGTGNLVLGP